MWVILRWIKSNSYPILALLLFIFSLNQVLRYHIYQHSLYFNSSVSFFRRIDLWRTQITSYLDLKEQNTALFNENLALREQLKSNMVYNFIPWDSTIIDTFSQNPNNQQFKYRPAQVIKATTTLKDNYIYLNQGSKQGIKQGMGVFNAQGIVGIVVTTSNNYSRVMSVLNSNFEITPMVNRLNLRQGVINWDGKSSKLGKVTEINRTEPIVKGDIFVTSNYSTLFPPNIPIAKVRSVTAKNLQPYLDIDIEFAVNFNALDYVVCVEFIKNNELESLESDEIQ